MIDERFLGSLTATVPVYGIVDPVSHEIDDFNAELWIKLSNVTKISRQSNGNDELFVMCVRPERVNTKKSRRRRGMLPKLRHKRVHIRLGKGNSWVSGVFGMKIARIGHKLAYPRYFYAKS